MATDEVIKDLQKEIEAIKARNQRVELDKKWETSLTRRVFIACITYVVILIFLLVIGVEKPYESAIIPAIAYLISVSSVNILKYWWLKRNT